MRSITSIKHTFTNFNRTLQYTIQGDSGLGRQLADALYILHKLPSAKLQELRPGKISEDFVRHHNEIQRELDKLVVKDHDDLYLKFRSIRQDDFALNGNINILANTEVTNSQSSERGPCVSCKTTFRKVATQLYSKICPNVSQSTGRY